MREIMYFNADEFLKDAKEAGFQSADIAAAIGIDVIALENYLHDGRGPKNEIMLLDAFWAGVIAKKNDEIRQNDAVNRPSHYTCGDIEVIDYIRDKLSSEQFTGFCLGNVLKYVSRHRFKNGLEDLKKAEVYLKWAIENEERSSSNA